MLESRRDDKTNGSGEPSPQLAGAPPLPLLGENFFIFPLAGECRIWYDVREWANCALEFQRKKQEKNHEKTNDDNGYGRFVVCVRRY